MVQRHLTAAGLLTATIVVCIPVKDGQLKKHVKNKRVLLHKLNVRLAAADTNAVYYRDVKHSKEQTA